VGTKDGGRENGVQERILATLLMEMDGVGVTIKTSDNLSKVAESESVASSSKISQKSQPSNPRVIVVGATNRPELLDAALKRPGRFDKLIHIPPPDFSERLAILQRITSNMPFKEDVDLNVIAEKSHLCSGADLRSICVEAGLYALSNRGMDIGNIYQSDFEAILLNFRPSLTIKDFSTP